jgi:hypothetical protein
MPPWRPRNGTPDPATTAGLTPSEPPSFVVLAFQLLKHEARRNE